MQRIDGKVVSVGLPVRNGARLLRPALESIIGQSYPHLEIIISDNASDDETPQICAEYAKRDPRIRIIRREILIPSWDNFRLVAEEARGEYFLWAADDDLRDANYVKTLLKGFARRANAGLVFSSVLTFDAVRPAKRARPVRYAFETVDMALVDAIRRLCRRRQYYEIFGLFRTRDLQQYDWRSVGFGEDLMLLAWLAGWRELVFEAGTHFYFGTKRQSKKEHIQRHWLHARQAWVDERLIWETAAIAERPNGRRGFFLRRMWRFLDLYWCFYGNHRANLRRRYRKMRHSAIGKCLPFIRPGH